MQCPKCLFGNREGAKFCIECGTKLEFNCSKCSHLNPPASKFCEECGSQLNLLPNQAPQELSFDEKIAKIQKYLPKGVFEKILAQKDRIEGERKQVTVMFCDMEGFTQLSEKLGPENAYTIMDQVYEILIHKVHDYEGTVNEMTGDGLMALFGAPIALEDAPQRAIRSAYAIHREMAKFTDNIKKENQNIPPVKMRVGIHTGPVVVGALGNDLRVEFKAVGDTVILASRMEGLAEPGSTYVTEETFKLSEGLFRFEALGEYTVKGKEGKVKTYRVIAPRTLRTRFDVSAERGLTPFVGRERELELLIDAFERSKAGRGQALSIVSEAGIGKSRLLYEFMKTAANEDVTILEGKCLSYSRGVAFHPVIDILKSNFDVREEDRDFDIRDKVRKGLKTLGVDEDFTLPYLLELLSVKDSGIDKIPMSPEARKDRMMEAVNRITLKGSEIRPLVAAIEDLHWIDKSSEECLKYRLDSISGAKVFLIFTYRPEFVFTWGGKSYHSQVNLNRISNRESLTMMNYLLGLGEIDRSLGDLILEKTEGVPFFIEEFIKSLIALKLIEKRENKCRLVENIEKLMIPSTIQDVLMARVDSLPEGAKNLIQTGSVIEREFSFELIKQVTNVSQNELLSQLSVLKDSELLYERGIYPHSTYTFKHTLTREVVYDSILTSRKKRLHEKIGNAIEEVYKDNINDYYGVLSEHYIVCKNYEKGAAYCRLASKKAMKMASLNVAIAYAKKRVESLENLDKTDDVIKNIINARTALGLYNIQIAYLEEAKEAIAPIMELALKHGNKRRLSQIYTILGHHSYMIEEDFQKAFKYLKDGLQLSEEVNDKISEVLASYHLGLALTLNCEFEKAYYHFEKAHRINEAFNNLWGMSAMKSHLSFSYNYSGQVNLGYQYSKDAIKIAGESGDIFSKAMAYTWHGLSSYYKGFFADAIQYLLMGAEFGERINYFLWNALSHFYLGELHFEIGDYQKSKVHYGKAIKLFEEIKLFPSLINLSKIGLTRNKAMNNERDIDFESMIHFVAKNKMKFLDGSIRRYSGETVLNMGGQYLSQAEKLINKAIDSDKQNGVMWHLGKDYAFYAELFKRKGDLAIAKEKLNKAIGILQQCGADGWVEKYEKDLAEL
jgi:predicted ATPase/class 3 adenylate cyclase